MKKVYSNENSFLANNVKNLILAQGIDVFIKNEYSQGAVGELSAFDAWPEVWVLDDADYDRAVAVVSLSQNSVSEADWICPHCGEHNDGAFEICWQCQGDNS